MRIIKGYLILLFVLIFMIPFSIAEISINLPEKTIYNLGEKIIADISIKEEENYDGFFKLSIICDDYDLQYYTVPLSVDAGARTQLTVPDLTLFKPMMGTCRIKAGFDETV